MDISNPVSASLIADAGLLFYEQDERLVFKAKVHSCLCLRFREMFCQRRNYCRM